MSAALNLLSSLKENSEEGQKDGSKEGDEEQGQGGGGDPAVLAVGPVRAPLRYSRDQLFRLRGSPLVKRGLENAFVGCEALAQVLRKRSDSPNDEDRGARGDAPNENHKGVYERSGRGDRERRSADPRERVRKESEPSGGGIVLSPQRRSFTSGCGAPAAATAPPPHVGRTRPESPLSAGSANNKSDQGRRIGSGRLMMRDMTTAPWEREEGGEREYREPYRPPAGREREERTIPRNNNNERYERRHYNRDSYNTDMKRERDGRFNNEKNRDRDDYRGGNRYSQRRYDKEDEPEWFSAGPTSQLETIELRGFDDPPKRNGTTDSNKQNEKWSGGSRSPTERWREPPARTSPTPESPSNPASSQNNNTNDVQNNMTSHDKESGTEHNPKENNVTSGEQVEFNFDEFLEFNIDEFLKMDSIPELLNIDTSTDGEGSRFSRWFQRNDSPTTNHYERILHNNVDGNHDLDSGPVPTPEGKHVFAPISPAIPHRAPAPTLLDLLRRANAANDHQHDNMNSVGGKMHSLEELEANLRPQHPPPQPPPQHEHDLSAFKRLLAQVSGRHAVPAEPQPPPQSRQPQPQPPQPMSLFQMLNNSVEQQPKPPHIPQELLYQLIQVQRQQQELQGGIQGGPVAPPHAERDLLQRPEAVALIKGLTSGEITSQHLMQQLSNPGLQSRHRDMLQVILRMHHQHRQMSGSPHSSANAAHLNVPSHHQPLRLSPLPHPAFCVSPIMPTSPNTLGVHHSGVPARIPSPRELAAHTQSIMQEALIKKKLEEQRENFRRRNEQLQHQHKQSTPISFTPTSVLRKMTAEKEGEAASPKQQQWNQPSKLPLGRPIVKGNQGGMHPSMGYPNSPAEYHYMTQQQQMSANRPFPHPPQKQPVPPSLNQLNMNNINMNMTRGVPAGTTLHQLLVESQQRSLNEMGGIQQGSGGGDNQLARWFSPELLARASAGKLPSVHVPNALSLEELERGHHSPAVRN